MKTKLFILIFSCLLFFGCAPQLTTQNAAEIIKTAFQLGDADKVEVLGMSKESASVLLVKFNKNGVPMNGKMRKYDKGWLLEEVQNEAGAWLPASTFIAQADPAANMKVALADINTIATALADYVTDNAKFPFPGGAVTKGSALYDALCPYYAKSLATIDPWGGPYMVYIGKEIDSAEYGFSNSFDIDFLVVCRGQDKTADQWTYDPANPTAGLTSDLDPNKDIINFNGMIIRGPGGK